MNKLSSDFLLEIIRICFVKKSVLEIVREHLKYQYIPEELKELKKILKAIITYYDTHNSVPSFGYVSQSYPNDIEVQSALSEIKRVDVADADELIRQLETYIKNTRFHQLYEKVHKLYNDDKADEAILLNAEESESIVNFSITKASSYFYKLFSGFEDRQKQKEISRQNGDFVHDKVPTGIREIDEVLYGGIDKGDTACFLARSKGGKSTLLKYIGTYDARLGYDVLHVSAEDSLDVCIDKYNQVWTGQKYINIKYGDLDLDERGWEKIEKVIRQMKANEREIYIHAYEQFVV